MLRFLQFFFSYVKKYVVLVPSNITVWFPITHISILLVYLLYTFITFILLRGTSHIFFEEAYRG